MVQKRSVFLKEGEAYFCDESPIYEGQSIHTLLNALWSQRESLSQVHLMIGPEASFSDCEREFIYQNIPCTAVSLGKNILQVPYAVCAAVGVATQLRS